MLTSIRLVQSYGRGSVDLERFSQQTDQSMRAAVGVATVAAPWLVMQPAMGAFWDAYVETLDAGRAG